MVFIPCLNTQTIYLETLPNKIKHAAMAGFEAMELWLEEVEQFCTQGGTLSQVKRILSENNIKCLSTIKIEGWFENDGALMGVSDNHQAILGECKRRIDLAAELGAPYLIACPSFSHRGHFAELQQGVDYFHEILELAKGSDVKITIEFIGQSGQINTIERCMDFLERVDHPDGTMVVDSYHLWRGGGLIDDFAKANKAIVSMLHINDVDPFIQREIYRDRDRIMPGDGMLDLVKFINIAKEIGFSGVVSLGVYNRKLWERDSLEVCREGYTKTMSILQSTYLNKP